VLTPAELSVLEQACRASDELLIIEKAVRDLPDLVVLGSMMQPKAHPLLEEARRHRALLDRLTSEGGEVGNDELTELLVWVCRQGFLVAAHVLAEAVRSLDDTKIRAFRWWVLNGPP
jgi:hypothetical protein